jgi:hypothetical protein
MGITRFSVSFAFHSDLGRTCLSELPCARTAALVLHYTDSFGASATAHCLTKLLLYWHDNRQLLPIRRLLCLLEFSFNDIV